MFCPECGTQLGERQKFCSECGTPIPAAPIPSQRTDHRPQEDASAAWAIENDPSDFEQYLDAYIRLQTSYTGVTSFLEGIKPLRIKWILLGVLSIICLLTIGPAGLILGLLLWFTASHVLLLLLTQKRNFKKYHNGRRTVDLDALALFLEENLSAYGFTAWQRGVPSNLGFRDEDALVVRCLYQNKTYHQIRFNIHEMGCYRIETARTTGKEHLKAAGPNASLLYKADCITRPLLEAAMQYYLRYQM